MTTQFLFGKINRALRQMSYRGHPENATEIMVQGYAAGANISFYPLIPPPSLSAAAGGG
jgi:dienelactone hydrolase